MSYHSVGLSGLVLTVCVRTVIVPNRDPGKILVAGDQVEISAVSSMPLPVVIECVDLALGLGDASQVRSISVLSVGVLVEVVSKVDDVINRVLNLASTRKPLRVLLGTRCRCPA